MISSRSSTTRETTSEQIDALSERRRQMRTCSRRSPAASSRPNYLADSIVVYVSDYNTRAKPFQWTWNATPPDSQLTCARDH